MIKIVEEKFHLNYAKRKISIRNYCLRNEYKLKIGGLTVIFGERFTEKQGNMFQIGCASAVDDSNKFFVSCTIYHNKKHSFTYQDDLYNEMSGTDSLRKCKIAFAHYYNEIFFSKYEKELR